MTLLPNRASRHALPLQLCLLCLPVAALVVKDGDVRDGEVTSWPWSRASHRQASPAAVPAVPAADAPRIDTYVINMDKRQDRCKCMQRQLLSAPQPVYRHRALGPEGCPASITKMHGLEKLHGQKKRPAEQSLFCNNYMIWEKANQSDADFVVILEDDALLLPGFWTKVYEFVKGCASFDYVMVDPVIFDPHLKTYSREFWRKNGEAAQGCTAEAYQMVEKGLAHWHTTTMTLIRKSFIPTLMEKAHTEGWGATDDWWQVVLTPQSNAYGWAANITVQASVGNKDMITSALGGAGCGSDVSGTDIGAGYVTAYKRLGPQAARLECPA